MTHEGSPKPAHRHRQPFASSRFVAEAETFRSRFSATGVMNRRVPTRRRKDSHMANAEATITENAATVAEQGAHVAPEKYSSKKGAIQKKGAPKGQRAAKGKARAAAPKKGAKAGKKAKPAHAKEGSAPRARAQRSWN
jgi:hypothetical protein